MFGVSPKLMNEWINPGRYVTGAEVADAGIAELVEFEQLHALKLPGLGGPKLPGLGGGPPLGKKK